MKYFFRLQFLRLTRTLSDWGLPPWIAFVLFPLAFVGLSQVLFAQVSGAAYLYVGLYYLSVQPLSAPPRDRFLRLTFPERTVLRIRLSEQLVFALPFLLFLLYKAAFTPALLLLGLAILTAFVRVSVRLPYFRVTPFSFQPFEFAVGFRGVYTLLFFVYGISWMGIWADNFGLSWFLIFVLMFFGASFYFKPEPIFYVWMYARTPRTFLWEKFRKGIWHSTLMAAPTLLPLLFFYPYQAGLTLLLWLQGVLCLALALLMKYASYPYQLSSITTLFLIFAFVFPPLLLGLLPYFYIMSQKNLSEIL